MGVKLVKKSKLTFKDGYVYDKKGNLVSIKPIVIKLLNELEECVQRKRHEVMVEDMVAEHNAEYTEAMEFKRVHVVELHAPEIVMPDTPVADARVEEAKAFAAECEEVYNVGKANEFLKHMLPLLAWCEDEKIHVRKDDSPDIVDTVFVGNPLTLTVDEVKAMVNYIFGLDGTKAREE